MEGGLVCTHGETIRVFPKLELHKASNRYLSHQMATQFSALRLTNAQQGKQQIREVLAQVEVLRLQSRSTPAVLRALSTVKAYQCSRLKETYQDLLAPTW